MLFPNIVMSNVLLLTGSFIVLTPTNICLIFSVWLLKGFFNTTAKLLCLQSPEVARWLKYSFFYFIYNFDFYLFLLFSLYLSSYEQINYCKGHSCAVGVLLSP